MKRVKALLIWLVAVLMLTACQTPSTENPKPSTVNPPIESEETGEIPAYSGSPYVVLNDNVPGFAQEDLITTSYEWYSELDSAGKCGVVVANIGKDLMPTEERGSIGHIKPTGWHTVKYDNVDGKYLYNRCHLIGFQLTGENANERNLITGTRYMNVEGMLPFENMVADYVKETGNHVLYRVIPIFEGNNLVASGVQMEALSVEDEGEGICFNVYVYNVQPGIEIDYATGESRYVGGGNQNEETNKDEGNTATQPSTTYILNTNTKKYHRPSCSSAAKIDSANRSEYHGTKEHIEQQGYVACKNCDP